MTKEVGMADSEERSDGLPPCSSCGRLAWSRGLKTYNTLTKLSMEAYLCQCGNIFEQEHREGVADG